MQRVVPVRDDDRLRPETAAADARPEQLADAVQRAAHRAAAPGPRSTTGRWSRATSARSSAPTARCRTGSPTPPPPGSGHASAGHAKVSGNNAIVPVSCTGASGATCKLALNLTVTETFKGQRLLAVTARKQARRIRKVLVVGSTQVTLGSGQTRLVQIGLNHTGRDLLAHHHPLKATLGITQKLANGHVVTVSTQTVVFKGPKRHHNR